MRAQPEEFKKNRGDLVNPAVSLTATVYRGKLDLFKRMRAGEFSEGEMTLRAKIDLATGNFNMRDPVCTG
jgi:glutaminyl-tRNA synthetase